MNDCGFLMEIGIGFRWLRIWVGAMRSLTYSGKGKQEGADRIPNPLFTQRCTGVTAFLTSFNLHIMILLVFAFNVHIPTRPCTDFPAHSKLSLFYITTSRQRYSGFSDSILRAEDFCFSQRALVYFSLPFRLLGLSRSVMDDAF